jgi:hypothetical protein
MRGPAKRGFRPKNAILCRKKRLNFMPFVPDTVPVLADRQWRVCQPASARTGPRPRRESHATGPSPRALPMPSDGISPGTTKRRGGSGCGNGGPCLRLGSRCIGRVGPSVSKITRARKAKTPSTSGRGRNQESEALNRTPSVGIRRWAVFQRGSAHEPPPEDVGRGRDVVGMLDWRSERA